MRQELRARAPIALCEALRTLYFWRSPDGDRTFSNAECISLTSRVNVTNVELPVEWILDDAPRFDTRGDRNVNPRHIAKVWIDEFDNAYEEGGMQKRLGAPVPRR